MTLTTIDCPFCGHRNDAISKTCEHCRIDLAWAADHWREDQEAERIQPGSAPDSSRPEITELGLESVPSQFKLLKVSLIFFFPLLILFIGFIPYLDKTWLGPCSAVLTVVVVGILIVWAFLSSTGRPNPAVVAAWRALARSTGLTLMFNKNDLALQGKYRDHLISMTLFSLQVSDTSVETYTKTTIQIEAGESLSLDVAEIGFQLQRIKGEGLLTTGDEEFNWHYRVRGNPPEFVKQAYNLIVPHKRLLLDRPRAAAMRSSLVAWTNSIRPSITLEKSELVCLQLGVLTRAAEQKAFLDLLCDIADLAEKMGGKANRQ